MVDCEGCYRKTYQDVIMKYKGDSKEYKRNICFTCIDRLVNKKNIQYIKLNNTWGVSVDNKNLMNKRSLPLGFVHYMYELEAGGHFEFAKEFMTEYLDEDSFIDISDVSHIIDSFTNNN